MPGQQFKLGFPNVGPFLSPLSQSLGRVCLVSHVLLTVLNIGLSVYYQPGENMKNMLSTKDAFGKKSGVEDKTKKDRISSRKINFSVVKKSS